MKASFRQSFVKDVKRIPDPSTRDRIKQAIEIVKQAPKIDDVSGVIKIQGQRGFYCIRIGDYRIGLIVEGDEVSFVRCLHRKDIYRHFP